MKLVKIVDQKGANIVSDPLNQNILRELVSAERSASELAAKFNIPLLNLWRRMQKMEKANLIELTKTKKAGNIEKKLYRATATWYAPKEYFTFKPKDPYLQEAFNIYSDIQGHLMAEMTAFSDVPKDADPMDYSLFANMQAFAQVCSNPATQAKISELKEKLAIFREQNGYLESKQHL
jgi:DNA-binding Lrp family transcriptional regulator